MTSNGLETEQDVEAQQQQKFCCCGLWKKTPTPASSSTAPIDAASYGYRKIAKTMAMKGNDFAIFRKFGYLNMLSLLSLQAELMVLQDQFKATCERDDAIPLPGNEDGGITDYAFSFNRLRNSAGLPKGDARKEQWEQLEGIRKKLKEYNETLLQVAEVQKLAKPDNLSLGVFVDWAYNIENPHSREVANPATAPPSNVAPTPGSNLATDLALSPAMNPAPGSESFKSFLRNAEEELFTWWDTDTNNAALIKEDLITVRSANAEEDPFQYILSHHVLRLYNKLFGRSEKKRQVNDGELVVYKNSTLARIAAFVVTVAAAALPVIAVLILYFIKNTLKRIYVLIGLTVAFAISTKLLTSAKSIEIFGATAAFVAVMVVFVGSPTS